MSVCVKGKGLYSSLVTKEVCEFLNVFKDFGQRDWKYMDSQESKVAKMLFKLADLISLLCV